MLPYSVSWAGNDLARRCKCGLRSSHDFTIWPHGPVAVFITGLTEKRSTNQEKAAGRWNSAGARHIGREGCPISEGRR